LRQSVLVTAERGERAAEVEARLDIAGIGSEARAQRSLIAGAVAPGAQLGREALGLADQRRRRGGALAKLEGPGPVAARPPARRPVPRLRRERRARRPLGLGGSGPGGRRDEAVGGRRQDEIEELADDRLGLRADELTDERPVAEALHRRDALDTEGLRHRRRV